MSMTLKQALNVNAVREGILDAVRYERSLPGIKDRLRSFLKMLDEVVDDVDDVPEAVALNNVPETKRNTIPYKDPDHLLPVSQPLTKSITDLRAIDFFDP